MNPNHPPPSTCSTNMAVGWGSNRPIAAALLKSAVSSLRCSMSMTAKGSDSTRSTCLEGGMQATTQGVMVKQAVCK